MLDIRYYTYFEESGYRSSNNGISKENVYRICLTSSDSQTRIQFLHVLFVAQLQRKLRDRTLKLIDIYTKHAGKYILEYPLISTLFMQVMGQFKHS